MSSVSAGPYPVRADRARHNTDGRPVSKRDPPNSRMFRACGRYAVVLPANRRRAFQAVDALSDLTGLWRGFEPRDCSLTKIKLTALPLSYLPEERRTRTSAQSVPASRNTPASHPGPRYTGEQCSRHRAVYRYRRIGIRGLVYKGSRQYTDFTPSPRRWSLSV